MMLGPLGTVTHAPSANRARTEPPSLVLSLSKGRQARQEEKTFIVFLLVDRPVTGLS